MLWTPDRIVEEIIRLVESDEDITYTGMIAAGRSGLYAAGKDCFGSWKQAVAAAGVPVALANRYAHHKSWTDEKVLTAIRQRARRGYSLAHTDVKADDGALLNAGVKRFKSWREAVTKAGENYDEHLKTWAYDSTAGVVFESLVDRVFKAACWEFRRHPQFDYPGADRVFVIPDFVVGETWWDAKLHAHAPHVQDTIRRYLRLTDQLTIVYLDGTAPDGSPAQFISIDELLEDLSDTLDTSFLKDFRQQLEKLRSQKLSQTQLDKWSVVWTREHVLAEIRALHDAGESLLASDVKDNHPRLYGAVLSKDHFTHWYDAVSQAGFNGEALAVEGRKNRIAKRTFFSKAYCMARLLELEEEGTDLSNRGLLDSEPSLAAALCRHWGSVAKGLEHVGIDPDEYRRQQRWTPELVLARLQERARSGKPMNPGAISAQDANMYQAAVRHFNTLENAASEAGLTLPRIVKGASWFTKDGRFSEQRFKAAVAAWSADGQSLITTEVLARNPSLVGAARKYMSGWYGAIQEFGYDVQKIRIAARAKTKKWSKAKVKKQIKELASENVDISYSGLRYGGHLDLLGACKMYFNGWSRALRATGLDPAEFRRKPGRSSKWSKEIIVSRIKEMHIEGEDLSVTGMLENHPLLYASAVQTYFDSWSDALRASGIEPESVRRGPPKWTKEAIIEGLQELANDEGTVIPTEVKKADPHLYDAIFRRFDDLEFAVSEAGLILKRLRRYRWTDEEILAKIIELREREEHLWSSAVRRSHTALFSAAVSKWHFKSWKAAIEAAGLEYTAIREQGGQSRNQAHTKWSKSAIIDAIRKRVADKKSLNPSKVKQDDKRMYEAACKKRYFGSWRAAVEAAGFRYEDFVRARAVPKHDRR